LLQRDLPGRAVEQVGTADDVRHPLQRIVHDHRQLIGERPVAAADDDVPALAQLEAALPLRPVLEADGSVIDAKARGSGSPALRSVAARARITPVGIALGPRATALEGEAERPRGWRGPRRSDACGRSGTRPRRPR